MLSNHSAPGGLEQPFREWRHIYRERPVPRCRFKWRGRQIARKAGVLLQKH